MKSRSSPYTWTSAPPHRAGWYWHRSSPDHSGEFVEVFLVPGEVKLSYQWGMEEEDVDFCCNAHGSHWAGPILEPVESRE